nr:pecanex-like protein 1 isoform X2 [Ciona intestinalis]|eukprot:XP_026694133.1 pecanex-like protein 1 isoform X2 [Ciona intestinalis]
MELWDELTKHTFADDDLFPSSIKDTSQNKVTVDVHGQAEEESFIVKSFDEIPKNRHNKKTKSRKREKRLAVDRCASIPNVDNRDSDVIMKDFLSGRKAQIKATNDKPLSSSDVKLQDNSEPSVKSIVANDDQLCEVQTIQRRIGFRGHRRPVKKRSFTKHEDNGAKGDDARKSRKRSAELDVLSDTPDLKRISNGTANQDPTSASTPQINLFLNQTMTQTKSSSLPRDVRVTNRIDEKISRSLLKDDLMAGDSNHGRENMMKITVNEFLRDKSSSSSLSSTTTPSGSSLLGWDAVDTSHVTLNTEGAKSNKNPGNSMRPTKAKPPRNRKPGNWSVVSGNLDSSTSSSSEDETEMRAFLDTLRQSASHDISSGDTKRKGETSSIYSDTMFNKAQMGSVLKAQTQRSSSSTDSDDKNMEENYNQCLHNFSRIQPQSDNIRRSMSTRQAVRHRAHRVRRTQSVRVPSSSNTTYSPLSREGLRHRHPAGDQKSQPEENNNEEVVEKEKTEEDQPSASGGSNIHFATNHADTTEGAVHCFQDEFGNWLTYTFGGNTAVATEISSNLPALPELPSLRSRHSSRRTRGDSSSTNSARDNRLNDDRTMLQLCAQDEMTLPEQLRFTDRNYQVYVSPTRAASQQEVGSRQATPKVKLFYKVKILPFKSITLQYDRLALMDLLDRNVMMIETIISILLASGVGLLGLFVLSQGLLHELWSFWFCIVIATSQFPMIRSVQPDSASPTHGHNRVIAYSRPVYFALSAMLLLLFNFLSTPDNVRLDGISILGHNFGNNESCRFARDFMLIFTCLLPIIFMLGLLPQINTFVLYLCEQVEMHMFGGTASTSFGASIFGVFRSLFTCLLLFGFCYGAMLTTESSQHILFSIFCGLLVASSYHLSRQTSSPWTFWSLIKSKLLLDEPRRDNGSTETGDPAEEADQVSSEYMLNAVSDRLQSDVICCSILCVVMFAVHCSTALSTSQPYLSTVLYIMVACTGVILHYIFPQLRKNLPWVFFSRPILRSREYSMFEVTEAAHLMWYEKFYVFVCSVERNVLFPIVVLNELTRDSPAVVALYGHVLGSILIVICGVKMLRGSYTMPASQFKIFVFTVLFIKYDARQYTGPLLIAYPIVAVIYVKVEELILKLQFWLVYVCPWQITWGSAFHAVAQVCSVPHSALLTLHALVASITQAPFTPFIGSALFLTSYPRPVKFWEKNYNTKRIDHSNSRLSSQLERGPHSDHNNLNSVFYEHLTHSLQKSLAGDLELGRWGNVVAGDCFILASDYLNALVHIVEYGNGILTFQLRGLEFSGTYCQQREVEAINEGADTSESCCCCHVGKINGVLSFNSAFNQRWMAWQVIVSNYVLDGYNISDNNATTMLGVFDLRKILISYIVKSVIFFLVAHDSLDSWITNDSIREQLTSCEQPDYVDVDSMFAVAIDDDYDVWLFGISRSKFTQVYSTWIDYCCAQRAGTKNGANYSGDSKLTTLCFAISVLARRALGTASHNLSSNLDSFLYGLYSLFKGDFRITSNKDEWVFTDMNLLREVVAPGVRMALKLHQDHFACPDEYDQHEPLYTAISEYQTTMVITHEGDPMWRKAVLSNTSSLLALRRVISDMFVDQYSVITLNHRALGFNVVKVNRECVRGLWAGQQNELIFLRNRNPERGSIQNAKQVLRNMINSSCDQPIGYPIYVSPLTTSYATTNQQLNKVIGGPITFEAVKTCFTSIIACLRQSCSGSCNSGGSGGFPQNQVVQSIPMVNIPSRNYSNEPIPLHLNYRLANESGANVTSFTNTRSRHGSAISGEKKSLESRARSSISSASTLRKSLETSRMNKDALDDLPSFSAIHSISGSSSRSNSTSDNPSKMRSVSRSEYSRSRPKSAASVAAQSSNSSCSVAQPGEAGARAAS